MFTLLGDISQGIHSYRSIQNWEEVLNTVFDKEKSNYMKLVQSYRTTIEVMNLANEIIDKLSYPQIVLAKPVIRHGDKPEIAEFDTTEKLFKDLQKKLQVFKKEKFQSIAVICKTNEECEKIKTFLDKEKKVHSKILDEKEESYEAGVVLVPVHLAKGLEFDVVLIVTIDELYEEKELDIKLL